MRRLLKRLCIYRESKSLVINVINLFTKHISQSITSKTTTNSTQSNIYKNTISGQNRNKKHIKMNTLFCAVGSLILTFSSVTELGLLRRLCRPNRFHNISIRTENQKFTNITSEKSRQQYLATSFKITKMAAVRRLNNSRTGLNLCRCRRQCTK